jgi:hypothetical protein
MSNEPSLTPTLSPTTPFQRSLGTVTEEAFRFLMEGKISYQGSFEWMGGFHNMFTEALADLKVFDYLCYDKPSPNQNHLIRVYQLVPTSVLVN